MSLQGKNRAVYSYNNLDRSGSNFMYKNFDKANCYHTNFRQTVFDGASLRATKFKYCNMSESHFSGTEFIGTNLRGTRFNNSVFENAIFQAVTADKTDFKECNFYHCIFDSIPGKAKNLDVDMENNIIMSRSDINISDAVMECVEDIIRDAGIRNTVIQLKNGGVNRISLLMLLYDFSEEELVRYLRRAVEDSPRNCTVSRLKKSLIKLKEADNM